MDKRESDQPEGSQLFDDLAVALDEISIVPESAMTAKQSTSSKREAPIAVESMVADLIGIVGLETERVK